MNLASFRSPKTEVRPSRIVGRGLFAKTSLRKGELVSVKAGYLLSGTERKKYRSAINCAELQIGDDLFLAPITESQVEDVMMFLNHSCEPNIGIQGQIVFVALRDIVADEELTIDYATMFATAEPMDCRCDSLSCRKIITEDDWRQPSLQEKYRNYFAWYLTEKIREQKTALSVSKRLN